MTAARGGPGTVCVVGVPMDLGAGRRGTDMGPSALRVARICERIAGMGVTVRDAGELDVEIHETGDEGDHTMRFAETIASVCEQLAQVTREATADGAIPLVLGGDHSVAMGSVSGVSAALAGQRPLGMIYVDAHGDMNTPRSSPSGNVHGMSLAALLGMGPELLTDIGGVNPALAPERTVLMAIRDLDARERELVRTSGVTAITMQDIDRDGMATTVERALAVAGADDAALYVSVDLDALDPSVAPGVGTPVPGGLTYREAHLLMELIAESGQLAGVDLVEVNPTLDHLNATAEVAVDLVMSVLGQRIL